MASWNIGKEQQPKQSGLYLTIVGTHAGYGLQYELNEFDTNLQRWLFLEPREKVHFWKKLPELSRIVKRNSPKKV